MPAHPLDGELGHLQRILDHGRQDAVCDRIMAEIVTLPIQQQRLDVACGVEAFEDGCVRNKKGHVHVPVCERTSVLARSHA
ncbi:hypothetical protein D3C72_2322240 [compost metagenome]